MKSVATTKEHEFLDLANIPRNRLPELIESRKLDMDSGFSAEELLPSVEYVRDSIRFMLYHMTLRPSEGDVGKMNDARIRGLRRIHLGNLEALIDARWEERLPSFIRRDFTIVSQIAHEAAKAFVEWCRIPNGQRTRLVRRLWKYFPEEN